MVPGKSVKKNLECFNKNPTFLEIILEFTEKAERVLNQSRILSPL